MRKMLFLFAMLLTGPVFGQTEDIITTTLLDHVMAVTQFKSGETKLALTDSVVQVGKINGQSIFDLQAGFNGESKPQSGEVTGMNLILGGFFKVSCFTKDKVKFPPHWKFLNSIEHGIAYFYDTREKKDFVCYQVGLAFGLNPK